MTYAPPKAHQLLFCLLLAVLLTATQVANARPIMPGEVKPLPDFIVTSLDGQTTVTSAQLAAAPDRWLLIYLQPNCQPCREVLRVLEKKDADYGRRVIVIVGGAATDGEVNTLVAKSPWIAADSWYRDDSKEVAAKLRLGGVPMIYGVHDAQMQWELTGVLADTKSLKSILTTWCETTGKNTQPSLRTSRQRKQ